MSEFIQGAYNPHEHDYTERTDEQLFNRMMYLSEHKKLIGASGVRLAEIDREMQQIAFEQMQRYQERKSAEIEQCYEERV